MPERPSFGRFVDLHKDLLEFRKRLAELKLEARTTTSSDEEAKFAFAGMADVAEVFYQRFRQLSGPRQLAEELERPDMRNALQSVLRGRPWLQPITAPDTFVIGLKKAKRISLSAKVAAIVSLWHSAKQMDTKL
jgi:hypothetical protein